MEIARSSRALRKIDIFIFPGRGPGRRGPWRPGPPSRSVGDLAAGVEPGHELVQRLALELADPLAGQAEVLADLAQGHRHVRLEAEPHPDHAGLAVVELVDPAEDAV